jgi:hypothetical protein
VKDLVHGPDFQNPCKHNNLGIYIYKPESMHVSGYEVSLSFMNLSCIWILNNEAMYLAMFGFLIVINTMVIVFLCHVFGF